MHVACDGAPPQSFRQAVEQQRRLGAEVGAPAAADAGSRAVQTPDQALFVGIRHLVEIDSEERAINPHRGTLLVQLPRKIDAEAPRPTTATSWPLNAVAIAVRRSCAKIFVRQLGQHRWRIRKRGDADGEHHIACGELLTGLQRQARTDRRRGLKSDDVGLLQHRHEALAEGWWRRRGTYQAEPAGLHPHTECGASRNTP